MIQQNQLKQMLIERIQSHFTSKDNFLLYLFGSYVWGESDVASDIDLLLVSTDDKDPHFLIKELYKSLADIEQDIDILGYSKTLLDKKSKKNLFLKKILNEGKKIYGTDI
jgi:predicted nucleotidyltransferase